MSWLDDLKNSCRISEVISRYTPIGRPPSSKYVIRCPFHSEKTPSFSVDENRNMFYCFGCKAAGDSIKFIQKVENLSFMDACSLLASWYGISISKNQKNSDIDLMKDVISYFKNNLQIKSDVINYLHSRGLTDETIAKYELGWFPKVDEFMSFCVEKQLNKNILENLGIRKILFLLENRIIFPIYSGRVAVAFGGRIVPSLKKEPLAEEKAHLSQSSTKNQPKYLNTAETTYFKKKEILYGYNHLDRRKDYTLLVEGYFDVLICHQRNINAVAPLGTATSVTHIQKIWNDFEEVIVCFDGDKAGRNAANKLTLEVIPEVLPGKILSFIDLPEGEDPATFFSREVRFEDFKVTFAAKLWEIFDPKSEPITEKRIARYNDLLSKLKLVKDDNLRNAYLIEFRKRWMNKTEKKEKKYVSINPKETYQLILVYTIIYFPDILDRVCDYFMSLDLSKEFSNFRELILSQKVLDKDCLQMVQSSVAVCSLNNLSKIAPFVRSAELDLIEAGWMEIFGLYNQLIEKEKNAKRK